MKASLLSGSPPNAIRKLNLSKDLDQVADLIELCFPIHSDPDGQAYVREMRKASRDMRLLGWLSQLSEIESSKVAGFVWEENGQIVGNLSLIPFHQGGRRIHLIANVAVNPDYRRRGIARSLTERALRYLNHQNEVTAWLQVRDDNSSAINLYRSLGFIDQAARTTWRIRPVEFKSDLVPRNSQYRVRHRRKGCWKTQKFWLDKAYPNLLRWNLQVDFTRFEPGLLQSLSNFLDGVTLKHWAVEGPEPYYGVITWQKTSNYANNLWLAFAQETEAEVLPMALAAVLRKCASQHPISIDYPQGRFSLQFERLGFSKFRTLIWMSSSLK